MGDEKLDKNGLIKVWLKIWTLIKLIVGDVDIVDKGDLQTQINNMGKRVSECFQSASDGKNLLADAITGKGVPTEANDTFATMAENISNIKEADDSINEESPNYRTGYNAGVAATKKGTAGTGDVLTGKTFTNASSVEAAGAMANKGAVTVDSGPVTQDDTYTYLAVPAAAFYNANSKLRTKNSNISRRYEIPVTLTSHCAATTNNDIHHGEKNVNFTIIIDNNRLTISGDTSIATGADGFAYYAIATASATIGQIVIK